MQPQRNRKPHDAPDAMRGWHDLFVAEAGASAALAGLLFVPISINLTHILEYRHLPSRAVEALLALLSVPMIATFALVPTQSTRAYAAEIGASGLVMWTIWALQTVALARTWKDAHPRAKSTARILTN
jgi:hypothetical protein